MSQNECGSQRTSATAFVWTAGRVAAQCRTPGVPTGIQAPGLGNGRQSSRDSNNRRQHTTANCCTGTAAVLSHGAAPPRPPPAPNPRRHRSIAPAAAVLPTPAWRVSQAARSGGQFQCCRSPCSNSSGRSCRYAGAYCRAAARPSFLRRPERGVWQPGKRPTAPAGQSACCAAAVEWRQLPHRGTPSLSPAHSRLARPALAQPSPVRLGPPFSLTQKRDPQTTRPPPACRTWCPHMPPGPARPGGQRPWLPRPWSSCRRGCREPSRTGTRGGPAVCVCVCMCVEAS